MLDLYMGEEDRLYVVFYYGVKVLLMCCLRRILLCRSVSYYMDVGKKVVVP